MAGMTTRILGGALAVALLAPAARAAPDTPGTPWKRAEVFATCSGRLAAVATRQQADGNPAWSETRAHREMFDLMLEATLPSAMEFGVPRDEPVRWRSAGWVEMAGLLADMVYSGDAGRTARAQDALTARMADCTGLLLGG
ncbi:hypothetical protein SAMN05444722_0909 [Rhodovulum sp. ES.010]|uniref:hypothetical protein n=1 Tax=Rhodovulum sp. ES.010 TaxID=1882821 RepID=UPI0009287691|nr:hypothetical protein [Rhodovulum sp. ES.010]SIO22711.1 hypothetical protein SAMN05444722_0909 [Rhodovulum sp. ES.010]